MTCTLILVALFISFAWGRRALASPCISFDSDFNLLVFGLGAKDYNAGSQDLWAGDKLPVDITSSGRPPFDGSSTTCYLSQFSNAVYILGADKTNPSAINIYDATAKAWSTQKVDTGSFDPKAFSAILDRDTNVFYALSHGVLFLLDMGSLKGAKSTALSWENVQTAPLSDNYRPVMALAQNHIHFLGVPDVPAGSAEIFVIHYSYFQPEVQAYTGKKFPNAYGQVASFFRSEEVQEEFAFIPDDGSATYIVNVQRNSTRTLPAPPNTDPLARYAAGITSLVRLDSSGSVSFIPFKPGSTAASTTALWSPIKPIAKVAPPDARSRATSDNGTGTGTGAGAESPDVRQRSGIPERSLSGTGTALILVSISMILFS